MTDAARLLTIGITALAAYMAVGCRTCHCVAADTTTRESDSVRTETRVTTRLVRDTVLVPVPKETERWTGRDTVSRLEDDYAVSIARVNPDGTLTHVLRTKPHDVAVPVAVPETENDSVVYRTRTVNHYATKLVPRKLNAFEKTGVWGFYGLLSAGAVCLAVKLWRRRLRMPK